METILKFVQGTVAVVITFGLAVFVHEFGHMIFALLRGVGVESFALGMGPRITSWKWRGIDFSLRWFPVGGFVKLQGRTPPTEQPAADAPSDQSIATISDLETDTGEPAGEKSVAESAYDDLYALQDKGFITKLLVFGGGVFMNFMTAMVAIALVLWVGQKIDLYQFDIEKVKPGSMPALVGLQADDRVVAFNGEPIQYVNDFEEKIGNLIDRGFPVNFSLTVDRKGVKQDLKFTNVTEKQIANWIKDDVVYKMPTIVGGGPAFHSGG